MCSRAFGKLSRSAWLLKQDKFVNGKYEYIADIIKDFDQICKNCRAYTQQEGHVILTQCTQLEKAYRNRFDKLKEQMKAQGNHASQGLPLNHLCTREQAHQAARAQRCTGACQGLLLSLAPASLAPAIIASSQRLLCAAAPGHAQFRLLSAQAWTSMRNSRSTRR